MESSDPPLRLVRKVETPAESLVEPCLEMLRRLRLIDRHLAGRVRELVEDGIPGLSVAMTEALAVSPDWRDRDRAAVNVSEVIGHDHQRGMELADALLRDETVIAMTVADYLQFGADLGFVAAEDIATLRASNPDVWWPEP